ncbi:hypothetical protein LVJ83_09215 [Uruburuella testudinis]|uniref:YqjK-like protein n=1 Tax=Uruburuella testudinis TaxID=1282863 RepID=A0ABY4DQ17_9NEIS|nr:hypothetical protein [Uruburuella testudinis]UOO81153.1 hypothetical protein LVJ83_09215 [Uruburuella testudinis]
MKINANEQRELLELQAQLTRLKIAAEYLKQQKAREQQSIIDSGFNKAVGLTHQALSLSNGLPSSRLLWNSVFLPLRWRQRLLMGAALLLWKYWRDSQSSANRMMRKF